jgi:2-polyprenyl-3-methyl-5-hydroxy-6-metoxy-1,4-benzoquinol methylase
MKCPICDNKNLVFFCKKNQLKFFLCHECKVIVQEDFENKENSPDYGTEAILHHYDFPFISRYIGGGKILARFKRAQYNANFLLRHLLKMNYTEDSSADSGVLDVGGGTGENLYILKHTPVFEKTDCVLMERSRIDRNIASSLYGLNTVADFSDIVQKKFRVITVHHVLEHISTPHKFIDVVKAHLVDNGFVFLTMPDPFAWYPRLRRAKWAWFNEDHFILYSVSACEKLFQQHGFQLIAQERYFLEEPFSYIWGIRTILSCAIRNCSLPKVLQDGYTQIYHAK